ncbi:MAG TPA: 50S ribosomal protein L4 [Terriglobales bacterium]|nr:50S ribosomal protein L4 [Terriglobales bacterium]
MPSIAVKNLNNDTVGSFELLDEVFAAPVNEELLWEAVRHWGAAQRRGTHKTKGRAEVSGAGRKLWKQKGTGRARVGSIRTPLWRHGGTVHGPQPRSYAWAMPRKKLLGALRSALAAKYRDAELVVVENFDLSAPKSKLLRQGLDKLAVKKSALLVDAEPPTPLERSARNLAEVELLAARNVHPYHLLRYQQIILSRPALEKLQKAAQPAPRPGSRGTAPTDLPGAKRVARQSRAGARAGQSPKKAKKATA